MVAEMAENFELGYSQGEIMSALNDGAEYIQSVYERVADHYSKGGEACEAGIIVDGERFTLGGDFDYGMDMNFFSRTMTGLREVLGNRFKIVDEKTLQYTLLTNMHRIGLFQKVYEPYLRKSVANVDQKAKIKAKHQKQLEIIEHLFDTVWDFQSHFFSTWEEQNIEWLQQNVVGYYEEE